MAFCRQSSWSLAWASRASSYSCQTCHHHRTCFQNHWSFTFIIRSLVLGHSIPLNHSEKAVHLSEGLLCFSIGASWLRFWRWSDGKPCLSVGAWPLRLAFGSLSEQCSGPFAAGSRLIAHLFETFFGGPFLPLWTCDQSSRAAGSSHATMSMLLCLSDLSFVVFVFRCFDDSARSSLCLCLVALH